MPSPPSPYRVLAFALECGDRRLTALLAARLLPQTPFRPAAAWRTVAMLTTALDLS